MEIKIQRSELLKGLTLVQGVTEKKSTMPILSNILFEATSKGLTLTATDLEVGIVENLNADVIAEGRVAIHARGIHDIVRELPENVIHLKEGENKWVSISCGSSDFKIVGLTPEEFPALPKKGEGSAIQLEAAALSAMIEKTSFAMSTDEARYALNGAYVEHVSDGGKNYIRFVATDGHRLSITQREIPKKWELKKGVILPRKGVMELKKLADNVEDEKAKLNLWVDEKHAIVYSGSVTLIIRLIDGQFPPYNQVVPKTTKRVIAVSREQISHALKRVSIVASGQTRGVRFAVSPKNLEISSSNPDFGEAREALTAEYRGDSFEIGFNARYFLDVLNVLEDERTQLRLGDDTAPCLITSEADPGFTHIIMPMRL